MKKFFVSVVLLTIFISCQNVDPVHQHTFSDEFKFNSITHWHPATCEHQDVISGMENHKLYIPNDNPDIIALCECGYKKSLKDEISYDDLITEIEDLKKLLEKEQEKNKTQDSLLNGYLTENNFFDENNHWKFKYENGELIQIDKQDHSFTSNVIKESSCEEKGSLRFSCNHCDYYYEEETALLAHQEIYKYVMSSNGKEIYRETYCSKTHELLNKEFFKAYTLGPCERLKTDFTDSKQEIIYKNHIMDKSSISEYSQLGDTDIVLGKSKCLVCEEEYLWNVPIYFGYYQGHPGEIRINEFGNPYFFPKHFCDTKKVDYNGETYNLYICLECGDIVEQSQKPSDSGKWIMITYDGSELSWEPDVPYHPTFDCVCETRVAYYDGEYYFVFLCTYCNTVQWNSERPVSPGDWVYDKNTSSIVWVECE